MEWQSVEERPVYIFSHCGGIGAAGGISVFCFSLRAWVGPESSVHTFSRSPTSSSVQIKQSDLTLVAFPWVLPLLRHIASNKAKYVHLEKTKNLTLFDTNTNLPTNMRLMGYCACYNPDTCGRGDLIQFVPGYVWTRKLRNPERKVYGFKSIRIRVDGA